MNVTASEQECTSQETAPDTGSHLPEFIDWIASWKTRPSWDEYFMATAFLIASRSPCERLHVGCVLISGGDPKNRLIAAGYNGFLPGVPHKSYVSSGHEQATVHAEQNAISDAARRGVSVKDATAYITHFPCITCTKSLIASGIKTIKYHSDYNNENLVPTLLAESDIIIQKFG